MQHRLELTILSQGGTAVAVARCGADVATRWFPVNPNLANLKGFRQTLIEQLRGNAPLKRLTVADAQKFGRDLFDFVISGDIDDLYKKLTHNDVISWKVLTDSSDFDDIPWEFLQEPKGVSPRRTRSVVRILQTVGMSPPDPLPRTSLTRVLLVAAEPVGLRNVGWQDIEQRLRREYGAKSPLQLDVIEGTDRQSLLAALTAKQFDIVHFSCHGDASGQGGRLVLMNRATGAPDYVSAQQIGQVLTGRNLRGVILSACESSLPGAQPTTYSNVAQTLIKMGIPVVVANQASIKVPSMATFVGALYRELLQSGNIDIAMAEARLALSTELSVEWGVPTLHRLYGGSQVYQ